MSRLACCQSCPVGGGVSAGSGTVPSTRLGLGHSRRDGKSYAQRAFPADCLTPRPLSATPSARQTARGRRAIATMNSGTVGPADQTGRRLALARSRSAEPRQCDALLPEPAPPRRSKPAIAPGWRQSCRCSDHLSRDRQLACLTIPVHHHAASPVPGPSANAAAGEPSRPRPPVCTPGHRSLRVGSELSVHDQAYVDRCDP